jgi:hypothetical protein
MEMFFTLSPLRLRVRLSVDASRLELERVEKWTPRRADDDVQHHTGAERMTSLPNENMRAVGVGWDAFLFRASLLFSLGFKFNK